ncbi:MAG: ParB N-terminal domain-containing protein [Candidatus Bathyarchaeia archaeon]
MTDELKEILLETVYWQEPTDITQEQIKNMALSLSRHDLIQPIVVAERTEKGYRGVIGRLRYEGHMHLEADKILARIHKFKNETEVGME